jgi:hypothetical protein
MFTKLPKRDQLSIAKMLWLYASCLKRHQVYRSGTVLTKEIARTIWDDDARMRSVLGWDYFYLIAGKHLKYATALFPQAPLRAALDIFASEVLQDEDLLAQVARRTKRPPRVFKAETVTEAPDGDGAPRRKASVWKGVVIAPEMRVNLPALRQYALSAPDPFRFEAIDLLARACVHRRAGPYGYIPVCYEQKTTGRVYETGSLQQIRRGLRAAALEGCYDYDISNCHYSIFAHWAKSHGIATPFIDEYNANKHLIREQLVKDTGADPDTVKGALISILYGASLNLRYASETSPLGQMTGAQAWKFVHHKLVKGLSADVHTAGAKLIKTLPRRGELVGNHLGVYRTSPRERRLERLLSHALQGFEAAALKAVAKAHGPKIVLLMHDGWVSTERLDERALEQIILQATGFSLQVESKRLAASVPAPLECEICGDGAKLAPLEYVRVAEQAISTQVVEIKGENGNHGGFCATNGGGFPVSPPPSACVCGRGLGPFPFAVLLRSKLCGWNQPPLGYVTDRGPLF